MLQTIGLAIVALGIIGVIWGVFQKVKAGRVAGAPLAKTGEAAQRGAAVAAPNGAISVESPVTGTPCLYYSVKCTATWKDGDTEKKKELDNQKVAARFAVDDGSGPVWIDAREGGDFEPYQRKSETKGTGLMGGITGKDIMFGNYTVSPGILALGTKFEVEETVMPLVQRVYACGKVSEGNSIAAPGWRQLLLSNKSRDELLSSATKGAKTFLLGGGVAFAAGAAMCIIGQMIGGGGDAAAQPTASTAAATTPAATAAAVADLPAANTAKPAAVNKAGVAGPKPAAAKPATTAAAAPAGAAPATTAAAAKPPAAKPTTAPAAATAAPKK
jgi:hypothetical protein